MARKVSKTAQTAPEPEKEPERYVLWRNDGPKAHSDVRFDDDHVVEEWPCLKRVSVPEKFSEQCEKLGLTRVGYARP
jgi:hypothetical protein